MTKEQFRKTVWEYYKKQGRHDLPWRKTKNPYKILVSEVMLQQTQVERVLPYYRKWIRKWPTARALARAPLRDVLTAWQGLGYNRRAKALHECAKTLSDSKVFPRTQAELVQLPGVGDYTASAVLCFAFDEPTVLLETNIRTAITHHFFKGKKVVDDTEVRKILKELLPNKKAREWNWALMDYGAHLKNTGVRINSRAKGYRAQSRFAGSDREVRGAIVRTLTEKDVTACSLRKLFEEKRAPQVNLQLQKLLTEGLIKKEGRYYTLPR